jgi:signal transduction histidine kinase
MPLPALLRPDILVSCVAHEINNPNNCILHNAQLVAQIWEDAVQVLDEYYQEHGDFSLGGLEQPFAEVRTIMPRLIAGIADGSCRIRNIIDSFKAYARTGCDGPGVLFSINSVILSALSLLVSRSAGARRNCLNLQDHLPPLRGSVQRMEQVVVNLPRMRLNHCLPSGRHCAVYIAGC